MSDRWKAGFIQYFFDPLDVAPNLYPLYAVGSNTSGKLGNDSTAEQSSPIQIGSLNNWSLVSASTLSWSMAVKTDGTMWAWGNNSDGQLGQNDQGVTRSSPVQIGALTTWSQASAGSNFGVAIKTDGTMWSWGANDLGELGQNDRTVSRSSPVQIGALNTWSKISCGDDYSLAVKTDGTLWAWGSNQNGKLGDGSTINRSSPVQVGALTNWSVPSTKNYSSLAIKTNNTVWAWGYNGDGITGQNNTIDVSSPVQIGALTNWLQVSCGRYHAGAVKTDGTIWTWGANTYGQLGSGTTVTRSSPVQIGALNDWSSISCGNAHTAAIKTDGTLWVFGNGGSGKLGQNNTTSYSSPVQVGTSQWYAVSAGLNNMLIIGSQ